MLGDLIYEGKFKITNTRVLNAEENKIEYNFTEEGKFKDIDVMILGTFCTTPTGNGVVYGEGQHIITTKYGNEVASLREHGVGRTNTESKSTSFRGSFYYKTSSNDKLAFLNNLVGIFEAEVDESGNGVEKVWEWN